MLNKLTRETDNPELTEERKKASFNTDELTYVVWESKSHALRRREITKRVAQFKELQDPFPQAFMTRPEKIDNAARKIVATQNLIEELGVNPTNGPEMFHLLKWVLIIA